MSNFKGEGILCFDGGGLGGGRWIYVNMYDTNDYARVFNVMQKFGSRYANENTVVKNILKKMVELSRDHG